jgi:acyl carrier protein
MLKSNNILIMEKLKNIFSNVLGVGMEKINDALCPENTPSWDSLNAIVLITEIEKGFGMTFLYEEAMAVKNFGDVINLLKSKGINLND